MSNRLNDEPASLSEREREVLNTIIRNFIESGVPVGSRTVAKANSEHLSPATIRSIMADLEEAGFVTHPHTSAGRMPTDQGYRYYVDLLSGTPGVSEDERERISQHFFAAGDLSSVVSRCCHLLSAATRQVGVVTAPDLNETAYRHVELVKLNDQRLLVLFVASSGQVHQHVLDTAVPESQAELDRFSRYLNEALEDRTLADVRERLAHLMKAERVQYDGLARRALELGARYFVDGPARGGEVLVDGAERLLERPDVSDFDRMKSLMTALEDKSRILQILDQCVHEQDSGVQARIGSEIEAPELKECALVATTYGPAETPLGTVGIIGPRRMEYERVMAVVAHVAELLSKALIVSRH